MKKKIRFSLSKKVFLLTASLSLALIIVSVIVASVIFNINIKKDARSNCLNSVDNLSKYMSEYDFVVGTNASTTPFITYYVDKMVDIYSKSRETIEEMSNVIPDTEEKYDNKKTFFSDLTSPIFGKSTGLGMSLDRLNFLTVYADIIEEMQRMTSIDGMVSCSVFYYDAEHNNKVFLCDSTFENSILYTYPGSVEKAEESFASIIVKNNKAEVFSSDDYFVAYAPIIVDNKVVAYAEFEYSVDFIIQSERTFLTTLVSVMIVATVIILVAYLLIAKKWLIENVKKLSTSARAFTSKMDEGDIQPLDPGVKTNDEINDLSNDFFALENKVIEYSEDIARKSSIEEHMKAELNIASKIQMQSLPSKPIIFGDVCISSFIKPAKEVGGDLFDYFITDDGKLFFVIADVTGKGVPAALFMMRGKEIIRSRAKAGMSVSKVAETVNNELCFNNIENLFITAFIGLYDPKEKLLTYVRAGHEQPFLYRNNVAEKISEESNYVLGIFKNVSFVEDSLKIELGDRILLYTDGLNEGINEQKEEFGYDRIKEALENNEGDILNNISEKASLFAGNAEQFDDLTLLLFENVKSEYIELSKPTYNDIEVVTEKVNALIQGYDKDKISELDVVIDELMNNYISYAFENVKKPQLNLEIKLFDDKIQITFSDNGILFNPLTKEEPNIDIDVKDRPIGGLGIMITKNLTDKMVYSDYQGQNRLTITKNLI